MITTEQVLEKLKEHQIVLPTVTTSVANYLGYRMDTHILIISGQLPMRDGVVLHKGIVGDDVSLDVAYEAARLCAINILAQVNHALEGDFSKLKHCMRIGGFVAATPTFTDHPKVVNGASDLMQAILGDDGKHARAAVGVASLPLGACVEVEAMFALFR